jgi:myosin-5
VFKIQQAEYTSEDIDWQSIDFSDNQPTIDLIEGRLGLLAILDEESRLAAGTDTSLIEKLNWQLLGQSQGTAPKAAHGGLFRSTPDTFTIAHYAHDVEYTVDGFLEKNRGTVPDEHMDLILASTNAFLREVVEASAVGKSQHVQAPHTGAPRPTTPTARTPIVHGTPGSVDVRGHVRKLTNAAPAVVPTKGVNTSRKPTQCSIFKTSLKTLMDTLAQTDIHYIRCIKPNDQKQPWGMDRSLVLSQLRACGVLETVRISCSGYPSRWTYEEFARRWGLGYASQSAGLTPSTQILCSVASEPTRGPQVTRRKGRVSVDSEAVRPGFHQVSPR